MNKFSWIFQPKVFRGGSRGRGRGGYQDPGLDMPRNVIMVRHPITDLNAYDEEK